MVYNTIMKELTVRVNGKINLTLDVVGRYNEVFHELDTVMASVGVFDIVTCRKADEIRVVMDGEIANNANSAYKAVVTCMEKLHITALDIEIRKGIPFSAGMGGSSADVAGVLYCVSKMFNIPYAEVAEIAKQLGSDVVYMLNGGIMRAGGKGDDLMPLSYYNYSLVIVRPNRGVNTKQVFQEFDKQELRTCYTEEFINCADYEVGKEYIGNALQPSAIALNSGIKRAVSELKKYSKYVAMTGSGSCVFAIMENMDDANALADRLCEKFYFAKACTTLEYGIKEI